jgi:hypothetical protein
LTNHSSLTFIYIFFLYQEAKGGGEAYDLYLRRLSTFRGCMPITHRHVPHRRTLTAGVGLFCESEGDSALDDGRNSDVLQQSLEFNSRRLHVKFMVQVILEFLSISFIWFTLIIINYPSRCLCCAIDSRSHRTLSYFQCLSLWSSSLVCNLVCYRASNSNSLC